MTRSKISCRQRRRRLLFAEQLEPRLPFAAEIEPNDSVATATALTIPSGENLTGSISRLGDQDYFKATLTQGQVFWATTWYSTSTSFMGGVEILDSAGHVLATRAKDDEIRVLAPSDGVYYLRITAGGSFGDLTRNYAIQAGVSNHTRTVQPEVEPNDSAATALALSNFAVFRGTLSSAADTDWYSISGTAAQTLTVDFWNLPGQSPAIIVYNPDGTELGRNESGLGGSFVLPVAGAYRLVITSGVTGGQYVGGYVASLDLQNTAVSIPSTATSFDAAVPLTFTGSQGIVGTFTTPRTPQYFSFQVNTMAHVSLTFDSSASQRKVTLYNERGQILNYAYDGLTTGEQQYAFKPGKYFMGVEALSDAGVGPYSYSLSRTSNPVPTQRDTGLFFLDLEAQQPTYLGYAWAAPFGVPAASDYLVGLFGSRYAAYDAEITRTLPPAGTEYVGQGYGRFTNFPGGGKSLGGKVGNRRPDADNITGCTMTTWSSNDRWGCATTMLHEFAHGTGLDHPRNAQNLLGYTNQEEVFPGGSNYSFQLDSRIPTSFSANTRDYLDWVLQPGKQLLETEPNDSRANAATLQPALQEMQADFREGPNVAAGGRARELKLLNINGDAWPDLVTALDDNTIGVQLATSAGNFGTPNKYTPGFALPTGSFTDHRNVLAVGDLNGDGRDDVAVAGRTSNTVVTYLSNSNGTLTATQTVAAGTNPAAVEIRDVNGDGRGDLFTANSDGFVGVYFGNGDGTFQARQQYATSGGAAKDVILADIDADGILDIVTANTTSMASVMRGVGGGNFLPGVTYGIRNVDFIFFEDVNGDGIRDLAGSTGSLIGVMLGTGGGNFSPMQQYSGNNYTPSAMGDLNGDGRADFAGYVNNIPGTYVSLGLPNGSFSAAIPITTTFVSGAVAVGDVDGDGRADIVSSQPNGLSVKTNYGNSGETRNDRAVVFGEISSATDVDVYSFTAALEQVFSFDIDSAEFQRPLDAVLSIYDSAGNLLATNNDALDRDSGITSVDPYLTYQFSTTGTYYVQVSSTKYTAGSYRLKVSPDSSWDKKSPRVIGLLPAGPSTITRKQQFQIYFDDQIDPASLTSTNIVVRGNTTGVRSGTATFDPFESALIWTGDSYLPPDTYTVTLNGDVGGIRDLKGNLLDGETDGSFAFPEVSGNGIAGGNFTGSFTISTLNFSPSLNTVTYERDAYNRGLFRVFVFNDSPAIDNPQLIARGAGPDMQFGTADDRILPLDIAQDAISPDSYVSAYTRGIPDPDQYRLEGTIRGSSGGSFVLSAVVNVSAEVPESALFTNASLTQTGIVGSYVNASLQSYSPQNDWRVTQTIAGTRVDPRIDFIPPLAWGARAEVGLTGGSDTNWNPFSVQWDGYLQAPVNNTRLVLKSTNGSRMWIDLNNDGVFDTSGSEFVNNGWGTAGNAAGTVSAPLAAGSYRIRVQYESTDGQAEQAYLEWITPDLAGKTDGYSHGPSVIDTSIQPGSVLSAGGVYTVDVMFSGAINPTTLTPANFKLRYSPDSTFYNGNDTYLTDADGVIGWNAAQHKATFRTQQPLGLGYYLLELNGDAGGIADNVGHLLDGEYLDSYIAGNILPMQWQDTPSGDGIAGGDYVASFSVVNFTASVAAAPESMPEDGAGNLVYTFTRTGDIAAAGTINFVVSGTAAFGSDYTQSGADAFTATAGSITFAPGATTATLTIDPTSDGVLESDESVVITISQSATYNVGDVSVATSYINNDEPVTFRIAAAVATATGVVVDFNRQFDDDFLNLYDISPSLYGAADLTLVGAAVGNVKGSLVVDPSARKVTFVKTAGLLAPDTYTLTLRSAADGFHDASLALLDGDADGTAGGDYVQTFVVNAAPASAVTLSIGNFARGPGQVVNLPASGTTGVPISFSDGGGITSATFQLRYNPALLTIQNATGAVVAPGLSGATVTIDTLTTPGIATIQFTSPTPLPAATTRFIDLLASVPATALYQTKQVLNFTNIVLNGGAIPARDDDSVHVVAYFGDATGSGTYSSSDATRIARLAVGIESGLQNFRLLDPVIVADITGNGGFSGLDTTRLQQAVVGLPVAEIPRPFPTITPASGGPDPKLSISKDLAAAPGEELTIPVNIDSIVDLTGSGLESAELAIYYDATALDVTSVTLGSLIANSGWNLVPRIDALAGRVLISLAGTQPLEGFFQGELVQLHAAVKADASGALRINLADYARDPALRTQLNEGGLTLVPAPTDAANDPVDGLVTIRVAADTAPADHGRLVDQIAIATPAGVTVNAPLDAANPPTARDLALLRVLDDWLRRQSLETDAAHSLKGRGDRRR